MAINVTLWIILILSVALLVLTFVDIIVKTFKRDFCGLFDRFAILVAIISSAAAVTGVLLVKQDMDLKNRPYVSAITKIIGNSDNTFICETSIKNSGNTPAYYITTVPKLIVNGEERAFPPPESIGFSLYPDSEKFHHFNTVFNPGDTIIYSIVIDYKDSGGKKYHYSAESKLFDHGGGNYSWIVIYGD